MRLRRWLLAAGVLLVPACGGPGTLEPGTIVIALLAPPAVTNLPTVELTGLVTRTPAAQGVAIIVTATKSGEVESDTADASGAFSLTITLTTNVQNQILVNATDESGSTATPQTVVVLHDGQAPRVSASTPANQADGVTPASVVVQFDEPVEAGSATMAVTQQGTAVAGAAVLATDGRSMTFTPSAPFAINAIYDVSISGAEDSVGNSLVAPLSLCFVTGGGGVFTAADGENDIFQTTNPPPTLVPVDLLQIRMARVSGMIHTIIAFDTPRSLSAAAPNNVFVGLDFDADADSATGSVTIKDTVFTPNNLLPHSGTRAEYAIWAPRSSTTDTSLAIQYTGTLEGIVTFSFVPSLCGRFLGMVVPETALGGDVGSTRLVGYSDAIAGNEAYVDPAPDVGYYTPVLTTATARGAPVTSEPGRTASLLPRFFTIQYRVPRLRR